MLVQKLFYFLVFVFRISVTYSYMWKYIVITNIFILLIVFHILTAQFMILLVSENAF